MVVAAMSPQVLACLKGPAVPFDVHEHDTSGGQCLVEKVERSDRARWNSDDG